MKLLITLSLLLMTRSILGAQPNSAREVVLPSSGLIKCGTGQLWVNGRVRTGSVYPVRLILDRFDQNGCPQGIIALYDKTITEDEIRASLDRLFGKWAQPDNTKHSVKLWRVEPERFAIQLSTVVDSPKETGYVGTKGMKLVIYLSFALSKQYDAKKPQ